MSAETTRVSIDRTQELHFAEAARHLTDEQLSAVNWVNIAMNAFNRISIVSRHPVRRQQDTQPSTGTPGDGATTTSLDLSSRPG